MDNNKGDYFGAFLGTLNKEANTQNAAPNLQANNTVLGYLSSRNNPIPIAELVSQTPISFGTLANALNTLKNANLVQVTTEGNNEIVELTDKGRQVAKNRL